MKQHKIRPFFMVLLGVAGLLVVVLVIAAIASSSGHSKSGSGDASSALANQIMTDGSTQLQANLTKLAGSGGTVKMDDANCVQTAGTQQYTCLAHYTVNDPSIGLSEQKYLINIAATCDSNANCEWHSTGGGSPVG